jgi:hypothetical protein
MPLLDALVGAWGAFCHLWDEAHPSEARDWGRFPERLPDGRGGHTHLNHL